MRSGTSRPAPARQPSKRGHTGAIPSLPNLPGPRPSRPCPRPRYRVQFTADQAYVDVLEEARNLLQHELPSRDLVEVQRRALELLVHKLRQRKHAATEHPRSPTPKPATPQPAQPSATHERYIPAAVRRRVWQRDDARCTYLDSRGQRCREQAGLEFHHQHPHARGGAPSVDNLTLCCRSHNTLAAEQDFGRDLILERRAGQRLRVSRAGAVP
jgi:5-methylcytosine-specific restriction endonuclease McrA